MTALCLLASPSQMQSAAAFPDTELRSFAPFTLALGSPLS